jgi:hypothetical protein
MLDIFSVQYSVKGVQYLATEVGKFKEKVLGFIVNNCVKNKKPFIGLKG